jgi:hypothetical protein
LAVLYKFLYQSQLFSTLTKNGLNTVRRNEFAIFLDVGMDFYNEFNQSINVNFSGDNYRTQWILSNDKKYIVDKENTSNKDIGYLKVDIIGRINMFSKKVVTTGFKSLNVVENNFEVYEDGVHQKLYYDSNKKVFYTLPNTASQYFSADHIKQYSVYKTKSYFKSFGDLILSDDYEDVVLPEYLDKVKERQSKDTMFISENNFSFDLICDLYKEPSFRTDGVSLSVGKGKLLFFEMLRILYQNGVRWIILQPACDEEEEEDEKKGRSTNLVKLYKKWGFRYMYGIESGHIHLYDNIKHLLDNYK